MTYEIENYRIEPFSNGLCFEIWKYRAVKDRKTGKEEMRWVSLDKYASTFGHALRIIYNDMMMKEEGTIRGLKAAVEYVHAVEKRIMDFKAVE